jgi:hypothetical protein
MILMSSLSHAILFDPSQLEEPGGKPGTRDTFEHTDPISGRSFIVGLSWILNDGARMYHLSSLSFSLSV